MNKNKRLEQVKDKNGDMLTSDDKVNFICKLTGMKSIGYIRHIIGGSFGIEILNISRTLYNFNQIGIYQIEKYK